MNRIYHIVAINEKSGLKTYLTKYPMEHKPCCVMLQKFTQHPLVRIQLEEVTH